MIEKPVQHGAGFMWRVAGMSLLGLGFLLLGCPLYDKSRYSNSVYHVYYDGNRNTGGSPPVDSKAYSPGDTAIVLAKPDELKREPLPFGGWRWNNILFQPGDPIHIGYEDIWFYAWWRDDPAYLPYEYALHPGTGGVIITQYAPAEENYAQILTIPDSLDGKPVTVIGEDAFAGYYYLESITLPSQLKIIGNKAFAGVRLSSIVIPDTVESIGKLAFQATGLGTISLGKGLKSIGDYAFDGNYLRVLFLPASVIAVGEGAFSGSDLTSIEIGGNVTIGSDTSMGVQGASFRAYYQAKGENAGVYLYKDNTWKGPYSE